MIADTQGVGDDGKRGIHHPARRKDACIHDPAKLAVVIDYFFQDADEPASLRKSVRRISLVSGRRPATFPARDPPQALARASARARNDTGSRYLHRPSAPG